MVDIPDNFKENNKIILCSCSKKETMKHIYECKLLNDEQVKVCYEKIFQGNIKEQTEILRRFENCMEKRENMKASK